MKVDWSKAPEWANYHAIDEDGRGYFYEEKPELFTITQCWNSNLRLTRDDDGKQWDVDDWKETLTERPEEFNVYVTDVNVSDDKITIDPNNIPGYGQMYYDPSTSQSKIFHNGQTYTSDEFEVILNENSILKAQVELLKELIKELIKEMK